MAHSFISPIENKKIPFGHKLDVVLKEVRKVERRRFLSSRSQLRKGFCVEDCIRKGASLGQIVILDVLLLPDALRCCQVGQVSLRYHLCVSICSQIFWMIFLNEKDAHRKIPASGVPCNLKQHCPLVTTDQQK